VAVPLVKIIDRYVIKHLLIAYGICLVSILGIFVLVDALSNLNRLLARGPFLNVLGSYLAALVPLAYYQIAPGTFLMAAMFTLSSLNRNRELLALRASGVSIYRVLVPIVVASLVAAVAMAAIQELIIPTEADAIRRLGRDKPVSSVVIADTGGNAFRIARYFPYEARMEDVVVTIFYPGGDKHMSIQAGSGDFVDERKGKKGWMLRDVRIYEHDELGMLKVVVDDRSGQRLPYVAKDEWFFKTDIVPSDIESVDRDVNYLTFAQLNSQYHRQKYLPHLRVKLHSRIASPLACFVLLLLGVPFALRIGRRALLLNVTVCIAVASAFFVVTFFFADMGADGSISPIAAAWLPVVIFTAIGLAFVESVRT
jgi:LPS export ABC transporter permease LptG